MYGATEPTQIRVRKSGAMRFCIDSGLRLPSRGNYAECTRTPTRVGACLRTKCGIVRHTAELLLCRMRHRRRTCARLCYVAGGELEQIQFLLGHVSVQTTEKYLGCKQKLRVAVNDHIGIEPED